ncbi:MAG: HAD family hydrolase [Deltaproteobacteria bacterium]
MKRLFIFDLDGTLVDAYPALTASVVYAVTRLGYPAPSAAAVRHAVGRGQRYLLGSFVKRGDLPRALPIFRTHHRRALATGVRWLPQARRVLKALKKRGMLLAIASNRPLPFTKKILDVLDAGGLFDAVRCADQVPQGKPHPRLLRDILRRLKVRAADAVYVGDMPIDIEAGRRAGIVTIGVASGSSSLGELKRSRPTVIIRGLPELLRVSV